MADGAEAGTAPRAAPSGTGGGRIASAFEVARSEGRSALMPYLMAGFPDDEVSRSVAAAYVDAGADLVELGVPFSDPLADGPVIHAAATRALTGGATFRSALATCATVADRVPVLVMCYANMVLAREPGRFADELAKAGAAGAIVPDLPLEEADEVRAALSAAGLALVPLLAPTTPSDRRRRICGGAEGFIYLVSDTRVTGERDELPPGLAELVAATRRDSPVPVAVGFGIGTPAQAASVGRIADGVIIGSRLVRLVRDADGAESAAAAVAAFLRETRSAISGALPR